jgi:hypothetical protein
LNGKKQVNRNYIPASSTRDRINAVRLSCAIFAGTLSAFSPAIASAQISLGTVVSLAQQNSTAVKLANADLRKAEAVLLQTTDVYVPNLIIGSSFGPPSIGFPAGQPSVANATMQSLAFSFPQRKYIEAARVGIQAANLGLTDAKEQVALDASVAYIELDTVFREMEAARQQSDFTNRLIQIEEQRSEAGVDPFSELLQARLGCRNPRFSRITPAFPRFLPSRPTSRRHPPSELNLHRPRPGHVSFRRMATNWHPRFAHCSSSEPNTTAMRLRSTTTSFTTTTSSRLTISARAFRSRFHFST